MTARSLLRRALAEFIGTGLLVTTAVGTGIAAQRLSADPGLQLLESSLATALALGVIITVLAPVSGAHINPVVSVVDAVLRRGEGLSPRELAVYVPAQVAGAIGGTLLANAMFAVPAALSHTDRAVPGAVLGETVATAGLILVVAGLTRAGRGVSTVAICVGAYIGAAYWFTSSMAFANPAVTIGRMFTDTFAGIAATSVLPFLLGQLLGTALGIGLVLVLFPRTDRPAPLRGDAERAL